MNGYQEFLEAKRVVAALQGVPCEESDCHPLLKPHQRAIVTWAVRGGRRAIFAAFGLGKTVMALEAVRLTLKHSGGSGLIILPLGVRQEFFHDAEMLGIPVRFIRSAEEVVFDGIYLTNYETVRDGKLDPRGFPVVSLDEAAILRSFGGTKTFRTFMAMYEGTSSYRFVATATPDPNEYIELAAYAAFLGVADVSEIKTRFFKRDSTKADNLTLHPHKEAEWWAWVGSWAAFVQRPSDLGPAYSDDGYTLPPMELRWHEVATDHRRAGQERDGQQRLFHSASIGVSAAAKEKRESLGVRVGKTLEIMLQCRQEFPINENGGRHVQQEGIQRKLLREEQREGEEAFTDKILCNQRYDQSGTKENLHEGVSQDLSAPQENPGTASGNQQKKAGALRNRRDASGENQATTQRFSPQEPTAQAGASLENGVSTDCRAVQFNTSTAEQSLCDLRNGRAGSEGICCRSRSFDGNGPRDFVPELQHGAGEVSGFSGCIDESCRVHHRQVVIWCALNKEQQAIDRALTDAGISYSSLYGATPPEKREVLLEEWRAEQTIALVTKASMYGAGVNLQQSHTAIFVGLNFKFSEFIQAVHRQHRFLQAHPVTAHLIYTEAERSIRQTLEAKWKRYDEQCAIMSRLIREHGLANVGTAASQRTMGVVRQEERVAGCRLILNDAIHEMRDMPANSIDLILTSIPFSTQYEYTPSFHDLGHTDDNAHFWRHMDFLTPNLFRALRPGRLCAIHIKDRVTPGGLTGMGFQTVNALHCEAYEHYRQHGFAYLGMKTIVTDVVRENNQTYRLGWSEQCKDGSRMGVGMPEYLMLFRKPPTDSANGYSDNPVVKEKPLCDDHGVPSPFDSTTNWRKPIPGTGYSRARWQLDAHGFSRSNGNRLLSAEELRSFSHADIYRAWRDRSRETVYDFSEHLSITEELDHMERLPATFMLMPPHSSHPDVWTDVARMRTLNMIQERKGLQFHLCVARDTLILTRREGYKPIQNVAPGDDVLTHKGRWRPVLAVQNTGIRAVSTIKAQGVPALTLTPDHKLWTRSVRSLAWSKSHARLEAGRTEPAWIEAQHTVGSYINTKLPPVERPSIEDEQHWWMVGRWIADGHIGSRDDVYISCGAQEIQELEERLGGVAGKKAAINGGSAQIRVKDRGGALRRTLRNCGRGAAAKKLPPEAYTLPLTQARALLLGYLSGDGHYLTDRQRWTASSISKELLLGVSILAQRVYGAIASIYPGRHGGTHVIQGRTVSTRAEWILCFDVPDKRIARGRPFLLDDGAWRKVRSVEPVPEAVETWNLRVEEDESFTAEGCVVKNCPLQFDIVDRAIIQYTMPGETVLDPFAGLMTVPYCAVKLGRQAIGIELNAGYWADGVMHVRAAAEQRETPTLFEALQTPEIDVEQEGVTA